MSPADHIHQTMCVCFYLCVIIVANISLVIFINIGLTLPIGMVDIVGGLQAADDQTIGIISAQHYP